MWVNTQDLAWQLWHFLQNEPKNSSDFNDATAAAGVLAPVFLGNRQIVERPKATLLVLRQDPRRHAWQIGFVSYGDRGRGLHPSAETRQLDPGWLSHGFRPLGGGRYRRQVGFELDRRLIREGRDTPRCRYGADYR